MLGWWAKFGGIMGCIGFLYSVEFICCCWLIRSNSSAFGELVRLLLPQIDNPLSSNEDTDPDPELLVRFLFIGPPSCSSEFDARGLFGLCSDLDATNWELLLLDWWLWWGWTVWRCFLLHRDWPVSRNPLANGLLSIFSLVIWSFCCKREEIENSFNCFVVVVESHKGRLIQVHVNPLEDCNWSWLWNVDQWKGTRERERLEWELEYAK